MVFYLYFPIQQGGNGPIFTTCSYSHINTKKVGKKREMLFLFPSGKVYYLPCATQPIYEFECLSTVT
jgi:hypothetical protein